jgi:hypothetical protein
MTGDSVFTTRVLVLAPMRRGPLHEVKLELTDRRGYLLAQVNEAPGRRRFLSWGGFGDARTRAATVVVADPHGRPLLQVEKQRNALRRPTLVRDGEGTLVGALRLTSGPPASPAFAITTTDEAVVGSVMDEAVVGSVSGSLRVFRVTDTGGTMVAKIIQEGRTHILVARTQVPQPERRLVVAAMITTRLVVWGARID